MVNRKTKTNKRSVFLLTRTNVRIILVHTKAKDPSSNGVGAPRTSLLHNFCIMAEATLYYCIVLSFMSSVSAIISIFTTDYTDQYSYYRKVIGLLSAP